MAFAQGDDYRWWNKKHNWDGVTSWNKYLIYSPKYFGPNALPIPDAKNGTIEKNLTLEIAVDNHFSKGDKTENIFTKIFIPLYSENVALSIGVVAFEHYKMDTITRDLRASRNYEGEGTTAGDFYIGTYIQIIKDKNYWPDILLTINFRTASGLDLEGVRYTEAPGYSFDLSFGKIYTFENSFIKGIKPYALGGLYVWQTNRDDYFQNDAFLYGIGVNLMFSKIEFDNYLTGYQGYIGNGDSPVVFRSTLRSRFNKMVNYKILLQQGLNDFEYTTLRLGIEIDFSKKK